MHVSIIVLNWNGWRDTIECLESLLKLSYERFNIVLIDNASSDESIQMIEAWANGGSDYSIDTRYPETVLPPVAKPVQFQNYSEITGKSPATKNIIPGSIIFIKNKTNLGFALANNQGITIAGRIFNSQFFFLLNNDTIIEKNAVSELVTLMNHYQDIKAAQSTIYSYDENKIINAGGTITCWGQTRHFKSIRRDQVRKITFINGCALFVRASVIRQFGKLSEKFFHGEEDFEFSMRMKKHRQKMVCSAGSRVYHKIGISVKKLMKDYERRTFLFALNRTVDLKDYYPKFIWYIWRFFTLNYFVFLLWIKYEVSLKRTLTLIKNVYKYSGKLNDVQKSSVDRVYSELNLW